MELRARSGPSIRSGSPLDAEGVAAVFDAARKGMPYLPVLHTPEEDVAFFTGKLAQDESLVATVGTRVVAFAIFAPGWLRLLYVCPEHQRSGLGSALLARVQARATGPIDLWTFQQNAGAQRFYRRHGFEQVEETDGRNNEEGVPDARFRWTPSR